MFNPSGHLPSSSLMTYNNTRWPTYEERGKRAVPLALLRPQISFNQDCFGLFLSVLVVARHCLVATLLACGKLRAAQLGDTLEVCQYYISRATLYATSDACETYGPFEHLGLAWYFPINVHPTCIFSLSFSSILNDIE